MSEPSGLTNKPSSTEVAALRAIARDIATSALSRAGPDVGKDFSTIGGCPGLPWVGVQAMPGKKISDMAGISASCLNGLAIQIYIGAVKTVADQALAADLERTVFSALVHELVHVRQCGDDFAKYMQTAREQAASEKLGVVRTPTEWISTYYGDDLEFEAHAIQLASEVHLRRGRIERHDPHGSWIAETEVARRIHDRLFKEQSTDSDVDAWWLRFVAAAASCQEYWDFDDNGDKSHPASATDAEKPDGPSQDSHLR